jgi:hypothetical protein
MTELPDRANAPLEMLGTTAGRRLRLQIVALWKLGNGLSPQALYHNIASENSIFAKSIRNKIS